MKHITPEVRKHFYPPPWDPCFYVNISLRKAYEKAIKESLSKNVKLRVLDYGCGFRPYEHLLLEYSSEYIGADLESNPLADVKFQPGDKLLLEDNSFDLIISSQVLEHVEDIESYMNECYRLLKKDGHLFLSTHGTWQYHASPYDYYRWTRKGLEVLMKKHGFRINKIYPILGQLALTSQLRLNFYTSFANMVGIGAKLILLPISLFYQIKMITEDIITPARVKERDSAIYLVTALK